ncbi:uncharacterized protein LOC18439458 isoform X2 [Amborella trichopoda]|uniref:uncharacterized protein LOC18439458 isoform X2 n=1 Tax=Amborella trichopoda TaxID=13333 RepID=UPI0009BD9351|nr:uncharacterized protein LOC18439458 isoform X2 [Amborella trichopoda]|eukprot:XP_020525983.1 uncharacterized protein LOC18439458 isoform X2 [Amborella trichopoda]
MIPSLQLSNCRVLLPCPIKLKQHGESALFISSRASKPAFMGAFSSENGVHSHLPVNGNDLATETSNSLDPSVACEDSKQANETRSTQSNSSKELMERLKNYGVSGVLSYGLLNTAYYLTTFILVWFYVAPAPGKMGYAAAVERFLKLMAMVWAGSQVTKIARAGGALVLAPFVDRGLSWFTKKFRFSSRGKAFAAIAGICFGLALLLFIVKMYVLKAQH